MPEGIRLYKRSSSKREKVAAPTPEQSQSLLSKAGGAAASGLHTIGSILSTPSRVLWGTVNGLSGGEGGFGNMNPLDSTGGIELSHVLGNHGVIAKNDPNKWEAMDFGRGLIDIAGDPTSWLPMGALTRAGQVASRTTGGLARGTLAQIRSGQRGLVGLRVPLMAEGLGAIGTGHHVANAIEGAGRATGATRALQAIDRSAPVTKIRQLFHASAMGRTTHATQRMAEGAYDDITHGLHNVDSAVINTAQNMRQRAGGPIPADAERSMLELGRPSAEINPLYQMVQRAHREKINIGVPTQDLNNTVKMYTTHGPRKALETHVLDHDGNLVRVIDNTHGGRNVMPAGTAPRNYHVPNTRTGHAPRYTGEGLEWGDFGSGNSKIALSTQAALDQHRNEQLFGNAPTDLINRVFRRAGEHLETLPAHLTDNQRARELARMIKREFKADDVLGGWNLTGNYPGTRAVNGQNVQAVFSRPREIGQFIVANPQVAQTGIFTNHPVHDMHTYLTSATEQLGKGRNALQFMGQQARIKPTPNTAAIPNVHLNEPLELRRLHHQNTTPTVLKAAEQLHLIPGQVIPHVRRALPREVRRELNRNARDEALRQADHLIRQDPALATVRREQVAAPLLRHIRNQMTLDLQLPSQEYRSLVGFGEHAPAQAEGFLKDASTIWKANMLAHPATQARNAVSAAVTAAMAGHGDLGDLYRGIQLNRGHAVSGLAHHPDVSRLMAQHGIDETEAVRRLAAVGVPSNHTILGDLPEGQVGSTLEDLTANVPGKTQHALHEMVTGPARSLVGYRDGEHVGWNAANPLAIGGTRAHERTAFGPAMASNQVARNVENPVRMGSMMGLMRQGYSAEEAARKVGAAQVQYGPREFSDVEKKIKQIVPFYAFGSRAGKHVATELASDPGGRLAQLVKAQDRVHANDMSVPDSILSGTAVPLGQRDDGTKTFLTGLGLQHEPAVHTLGALANGNFRGAGYDLLGMTTPWLKTPLEHITGQSFYQRGEPNANLDPNIGRTLSNLGVMAGLRDENAGPVKYGKYPELAAETALSLSPFSRMASTARTLTDTRKTKLEKAANLLTGLRVTDVSPKKQEATLLRRAEQLAQSEGAKSRNDVYFNKQQLADLEKSNPEMFKRQMELQGLLNALKTSTKKPRDKKERKSSNGAIRLHRANK